MQLPAIPARDGRREFEGAWVRFLDGEVGARKSESQRAAGTVLWFAVSCAVLSGGYGLLFYFLAPSNLRELALISVLGGLAYTVIAAFARSRRQLVASVLVMVVSTLQILLLVSRVGWESGLHLFLIATGVVVFMVFTERQRAYRWLFVAVSATVFVICQTMFHRGDAPIVLADSSLAVLASASAVITAVLVYAMSAINYYRGVQARTQAAASTARAEYLANTDALTGLENRRPIMDRLDVVSAQGQGQYAVAIADLDRFKELNDTYGHTCGDQVLAVVGELLHSELKPGESLGRWGGEEFIYVLPSTTVEQAMARMETVRETLEASPIACGEHMHHVTSSVGIADGRADGAPHRVVQRADDALYDAKVAGRNRVCARVLGDSAVDATGAAGSAEHVPTVERRMVARRGDDRKPPPTAP